MKISFPHMGKLYLALAKTCEEINIPYLIPPLPGPNTLQLGRDLAPEGSCLPFTLVLGNMREALEKGADNILMLGGSGPCRFGYFIYLADRILRDNGYNFNSLVIDRGYNLQTISAIRSFNKISWINLIKAIRFGWLIMCTEEYILSLEREYTAYSRDKKAFGEFLRDCRKNLYNSSTVSDVLIVQKEIKEYMDNLDIYNDGEIVRIGIVGDIYTLLEPFANYDLDKILISKDVCVLKNMAVSHWVPNIFLPWRKGAYRNYLLKYADPYLKGSVGGFGLESVANTGKYSHGEVDGMIQIFPMGCMPEIVARSAITKIGQEKKLPLLSITTDQHDSNTGFETRIEAFLELVSERKKVDKKRRHAV